MTVADIKPKIVLKQLRELEKIADMVEVLIESEEDDDVRVRKEEKLFDLRLQIEEKRQRTEAENAQTG